MLLKQRVRINSKILNVSNYVLISNPNLSALFSSVNYDYEFNAFNCEIF